MRINVYSQELTSEVRLVSKESSTLDDAGELITYHAVQLLLHSSPMLHHPPADDDRSAITLWLPKSDSRRKELADTLRNMAKLVLNAPPGTGLD